MSSFLISKAFLTAFDIRFKSVGSQFQFKMFHFYTVHHKITCVHRLSANEKNSLIFGLQSVEQTEKWKYKRELVFMFFACCINTVPITSWNEWIFSRCVKRSPDCIAGKWASFLGNKWSPCLRMTSIFSEPLDVYRITGELAWADRLRLRNTFLYMTSCRELQRAGALV